MPLMNEKIKQERTSLRQNKCSEYSTIRAFRFTFLRRKKGSLTVEAALVLPIFLFAMISLIYVGEAIRFSDNMQNALHQNARELSEYAYAYTKLTSQPSSLGGKLGSIAFSQTYVKNRVEENLAKSGQSYDVVLNGKEGVSFLHSSILKDDVIDLVATYQITVPFQFKLLKNFRMTNRARMRAWTGYDNTQTEKLNTEEEVVYITRNGTVYHKSRSCSHLKLSIQTVRENQIPGLRNREGGKYYACEYCGAKPSHGAVYITDYGDRYHTDISCSGLKRDIIAVPLSRVEGRRPCRTCGQ